MVKKKELKGMNEQTVLFLVFIALAVLVIGTLFLANPSFTGLVIGDSILDEGEECDDGNVEDGDGCSALSLVEEGWECDASEPSVCTEIILECDVDNLDLCLDEATCTAATGFWYGGVCNAEEEPACSNDLTLCDDTNCVSEGAGHWYDANDDGTQTCNAEEEPACSNDLTLCLTLEECEAVEVGGFWYADVCNAEEEPACSNDLTLCDDTNCVSEGAGHWYNDECNAEEECIPETCSSLDYSCGDIDDGCGITLDCGSCGSGWTCDAGACEEDGDGSDEDSSSIPTTTTEDTPTITTRTVTTTCSPNWECGGWSACAEEMQSRECSDTNGCESEEGRPSESQSCTMPETCEDGMKNQDEQGIDCGGVCEERCSIFTIVGNAVNIPFNSSKQFVKEHKALSFSVLGVVALAVSWIVIAKFVFKKGTFFFLKDIKFLKKWCKPNSESQNS